MARKKTFIDILGERLGKLPEGTRTVIALDPRRVLSVPSPFLDASNRDWEVFIYDRNDFGLRATWKIIKDHDKRFLIIATGNSPDSTFRHQVDLSYIPDILEEAEEVIDCSPQGVLQEMLVDPLPPDLFEEPLLSFWAENLPRFLAQLKKYQKISGKKEVLNRFDIAWVCLATRVPSIIIETIPELSQEPLSRLLFYFRAIAGDKLNYEERALLKDTLLGSDPSKMLQAWFALEKEELFRFLYLGLTVIRYAVPKGLDTLRRLGLLEFDIDELGGSPERILNAIQKDLELTKKIIVETEKTSAILADVDRLVSRFRFGSYIDGLNSFMEESSPAIVTCLGKLLMAQLLSSKEGAQALGAWHKKAQGLAGKLPKTPYTTKALKLRELLLNLAWLQFVLDNAPSPPTSLLDLVNSYHSSNLHLLELTIAQIHDLVRLLKDEEVSRIVKPYMEIAQLRVNSIISDYDQNLGKLISSDWAGYTHFARLNTQILRDLIQAGSPRKERVWIVVFDGMRLDSWDRFIWPELCESFEVEGEVQLYLATLPTVTDISRVAFFAGKLPPYWRDYSNHYTTDHNVLLSRHLGLGKKESKDKLKVLGRVEEKTEQAELDFDPAQYRVMIFNLSDEWIHHEQGSLVRINDIIREKFEKIVLPELLYRVQPEDILVITSDHGFIELRKEFQHKVEGIPDENISYRYVKDFLFERGVGVSYDDKKQWAVAVGNEWFQRQKKKGKPARYVHGGISMAEMVIPAVRLRKRTKKEVALVLMIEDIPECIPGDPVTLAIGVRNEGTVNTDVALTCRLAGRLVAEEQLVLPGGTSHQWSVPITADPKATQVTVSAEYTIPGRKRKTEKRQAVIPVKETGAKIEIDTSALDDFENM